MVVASDPLVTLALTTRTQIAAGKIRVPPYPAVVGKLQKAVADERTGIRDITQLVAADPVLTAMVFARASTAAAGRTPSSLDIAIARVGNDDLVRLALAASLGSATAGVGPLAALRRSRWQDALLSAGLCELLAERRGIDPELAYLAGLLHDFGAIVVIATLEEQLAKTTLAPQPAEAWGRIVERHHLEAAVHVAHKWKLPEDLARVMSEHHDVQARDIDRPLLHLVWDIDRAIGSLTTSKPITGLQPGELEDVTKLLPTIVTHIATFETAMPSVAATIKAASAVAIPPIPDGATNIEVTTVKGARYRATSIGDGHMTIEGSEPLRPDWLTEITVSDGDDRIEILVHVRGIKSRPGGFAMTVQPFGLGSDHQAAWARMVERAS